MTSILFLRILRYFIFDLQLLVTNIGFQEFSLEKVEICKCSKYKDGHNSSEILEYRLVIPDKKYPEKVHTRGPENRTGHVVEPEITFLHP